jgi:hypothetical protein
MKSLSRVVGQNTQFVEGLKRVVLYRKKLQAPLPITIFTVLITCYTAVCMLSEMNYLIFPDRQRKEAVKFLRCV